MGYVAAYLGSVILMNIIWIVVTQPNMAHWKDMVAVYLLMVFWPISISAALLHFLYVKLQDWNILPKGSN